MSVSACACKLPETCDLSADVKDRTFVKMSAQDSFLCIETPARSVPCRCFLHMEDTGDRADSSVKLDPQIHQVFVNLFGGSTFTCTCFLLNLNSEFGCKSDQYGCDYLGSLQVLLVY